MLSNRCRWMYAPFGPALETVQYAANTDRTSITKWPTELPIAFYVGRYAAVLRATVAPGPVRSGGDGRIFPLGDSVAGDPVQAQALGLHNFRNTDFRQHAVRVYSRASPAGAKYGLLTGRPACLCCGKQVQPHGFVDFGCGVWYRVVQCVPARAAVDALCALTARPPAPLVPGNAASLAAL